MEQHNTDSPREESNTSKKTTSNRKPANFPVEARTCLIWKALKPVVNVTPIKLIICVDRWDRKCHVLPNMRSISVMPYEIHSSSHDGWAGLWMGLLIWSVRVHIIWRLINHFAEKEDERLFVDGCLHRCSNQCRLVMIRSFFLKHLSRSHDCPCPNRFNAYPVWIVLIRLKCLKCFPRYGTSCTYFANHHQLKVGKEKW